MKGDTPTASIKLTPEYMIAGFQRFRSLHPSRYLSLAAKVFALGFLAPLAIWMVSLGSVITGSIFAALGVFLFFAHLLDKWLIRRSFQKSPFRYHELTIDFSDDCFHVRSAKQDSKLQWETFTNFAEFKDGFLLYLGPHSFHWIPLSSLDNPSQVAELATLLQAKIKKYKIVEPVARSSS